MEYNYPVRKEVNCWSSLCISSYAGEDSETFQDQRDVQLSFDEQPQPVAHPVYESPARRNTISTSQQTRHKSWFKQESPARSRQLRSSSVSALRRPFSSKGRPSIGAPTDFRRVTEPMPARRRSFRPLELSIYVESSGRLSPLPDFSTNSWELKLPGLDRPPQALLRRETVDNSQLRDEFTVPRKPLSTYSAYTPRRAVVSEPFLLSAENGPGPIVDSGMDETEPPMPDLNLVREDRTPTLTATEVEEMVSSTSRPWSQRSSGYTVTKMRSQPSVSRHSHSESGGRSSRGSLRRSKNDPVEEAIRELNTIVEEKRIRAAKLSVSSPPLSPTSHVPAIAPTMTVRARSETLNDIGSAFSTSVSMPLPAGSSPSTASSRTFTRSPAPGPRLMIPNAISGSADSSATALPQIPMPTLMPTSNPLQSNPVNPVVAKKDRLSTWLKRVSNASSEAMPSQKFYQLSSQDVGGYPIHRTGRSGSVSTISTFSSIGSADTAYATPATTIAPTLSPTTPGDEKPRPSISKTPRNLRRQPKRGLSIDTTVSNGSNFTTVPPAYHELDPHPSSLGHGELTPTRIGVAC